MERAFLAANRFLCGALLAASCALVFANVVLRYGFGQSLAWAEEVSRYLMIWLAFLAAGLALRDGAHIAVDALPEALPEPAARALRAFILLAIALFLALLVWLGWQYALFAWMQRTPVLRLSAGLVYLAIPVGGAVMFIHLLLIARRYVLKPRDEADRLRAMEAGSL